MTTLGPPYTYQVFSHLLHRCLRAKNQRSTRTLHCLLLRTGFCFSHHDLHTHLILCYATCYRNFISLSNLFKFMDSANPLPWNTILASFCHQGHHFMALQALSLMHKSLLPLDTYSLCSSLSASAFSGMVSFGKQVHGYASKSGWLASVYVGGAMIDFYAKALLLEDADKVYDEIPLRNTICANALLSGYAEAKHWGRALELFREMHDLNLEAEAFTLSAILRACAGLVAVRLGKQVHANIVRRIAYFEHDSFLLSSLVEMYGKCGSVDQAREVFDMAKYGGEGRRDVVLWTSMLTAYARNSQFIAVIRMFDEMWDEGIRPDSVAFVAVISACGHSGNTDRGLKYFESMAREFGMAPQAEHYGGLIDMLCRAGELEKAFMVMSEIPSTSGCLAKGAVSSWGALLRACEASGNLELGKLAAQRALALEPENVGIYMVLSNLYAKCGMWNEIEGLRERMKQRGLRKDAGRSQIEITR